MQIGALIQANHGQHVNFTWAVAILADMKLVIHNNVIAFDMLHTKVYTIITKQVWFTPLAYLQLAINDYI